MMFEATFVTFLFPNAIIWFFRDVWSEVNIEERERERKILEAVHSVLIVAEDKKQLNGTQARILLKRKIIPFLLFLSIFVA